MQKVALATGSSSGIGLLTPILGRARRAIGKRLLPIAGNFGAKWARSGCRSEMAVCPGGVIPKPGAVQPGEGSRAGPPINAASGKSVRSQEVTLLRQRSGWQLPETPVGPRGARAKCSVP